MSTVTSLLPLIPVVAGAVLLLVDHREALLWALLALYVVLMVHTQSSLSLQVALVKLLGGALVVGVLWVTLRSVPEGVRDQNGGLLTRRSFRVVSFLLVLTVGIGAARADWLDLPRAGAGAVLSASLMFSMGLLQLALFQRPLRVGLGLLTLLMGFEIVYSAIEPSLAMVALLIAVHFGIALVTGYLTLRWSAASSRHMGSS